jgi:acetyl esterase/lipase
VSNATIHRYGDDAEQFLQHWSPEPASGRIRSTELVLLHGGYWRARYTLELMEPLARHLSQQGWAVLNLEYRRIGQALDPWFAMASDIESALTLGLSAMSTASTGEGQGRRRRILIGHSAGGQLALWAAAQPWAANAGIGGVVALAPVSDLPATDEQRLSNHATAELFGLDPDRRRARLAAASPRQLLPLGVPQYVIHGDLDDSVPQSMSSDYAAAGRAAGDRVELDTPTGVDHFQIIDPDSDIWPIIEAAIERLADEIYRVP